MFILIFQTNLISNIIIPSTHLTRQAMSSPHPSSLPQPSYSPQPSSSPCRRVFKQAFQSPLKTIKKRIPAAPARVKTRLEREKYEHQYFVLLAPDVKQLKFFKVMEVTNYRLWLNQLDDMSDEQKTYPLIRLTDGQSEFQYLCSCFEICRENLPRVPLMKGRFLATPLEGDSDRFTIHGARFERPTPSIVTLVDNRVDNRVYQTVNFVL